MSRERTQRTLDPFDPARSIYDWVILSLCLLPSCLGMFLFGAVRLWSIGPLMLGVFVALLMFCARPLIWRDERVFVAPPGAWALGALLGYLLVHACWFSTIPYEARLKGLMILSAAASYWIWTCLAGREGRWKVLVGILLLCIGADAWYAVVQNYLGSRMVLNLERPAGYAMRASGSYFCPNHFANMLGIGVCASFALIWPRRLGLGLRLICVNALALGLYAWYLSQSRSGILGILAGVTVAALLLAFRKSPRVFAVAAVAVPALAAGVALAGWRFLPAIRDRFLLGLNDGGAGRLTMWEGTLHLIRTAPWLGLGGGSFRFAEPPYQLYPSQITAIYAHNESMHMVAEYGVVGLVLALAFFLALAVGLLRRLRDVPLDRNAALMAGAIGATAAGFVHSMFDYNLHIYSNSMATVLLLGCSAALAVRPKPAKSARSAGSSGAVAEPGAAGGGAA